MRCSLFIALISENYMRSSNCRDELNYAREKERPLLLVYLEETKLPAGMEMRLGRIRAIHREDCESPADFYAKLFSADGIAVCGVAYDGKKERAAVNGNRRKVSPSEETGGASLRWLGVLLILLLGVGVFFLFRSQLLPKSSQPPAETAFVLPTTMEPVTTDNMAEVTVENTPEPVASEEPVPVPIPESTAAPTPETPVYTEPEPTLTQNAEPSPELQEAPMEDDMGLSENEVPEDKNPEDTVVLIENNEAA